MTNYLGELEFDFGRTILDQRLMNSKFQGHFPLAVNTKSK